MLPDIFSDPLDVPMPFLSFTIHWLSLKQIFEYKISPLGLLVLMWLNVHINLGPFLRDGEIIGGRVSKFVTSKRFPNLSKSL